MDLPNPKELKALLKVCREYGVDNVEIGELKIKFGAMPQEAAAESADGVVMAAPSDKDLLYWSSQPDPLDTMQEARQ